MATCVETHAFDDFQRVGVDDLVGFFPARRSDIESRDGALLRLEENIQGPVTGFTACAH